MRIIQDSHAWGPSFCHDGTPLILPDANLLLYASYGGSGLRPVRGRAFQQSAGSLEKFNELAGMSGSTRFSPILFHP